MYDYGAINNHDKKPTVPLIDIKNIPICKIVFIIKCILRCDGFLIPWTN